MTEGERRRGLVREATEALLIAIVFVNFARVFVFQAFRIPTPSMVDNLLIGDHLLVNKFAYGPSGSSLIAKLFPLREVSRGDIVVFRYPVDPEVDFVKRVIALPGETVAIRDKVVHIDGRRLPEPYKLHSDEVIYRFGPASPEPFQSRDQFGPYTVPDASYFVLGDNRDYSNDSRFWGIVPRELIKGRALMVYWSWARRLPVASGRPNGGGLFDRIVDSAEALALRIRWRRIFFIIDSKYHYGVGEAGAIEGTN